MAERALVREVAAESAGYFAPVRSTPGFADAARRLVRELRQEGVTPAELAQNARRGAESAGQG